MGIGLYTSRLVLQALGVVDYGVYGLVGGIVTMFSFMNSAMSSATQRYLTFDIGLKDYNRLQKTFNASLNIHIVIGVIILVLAETIGLWFVNYKLNIPADRLYAANWVYQFSIFTFILTVTQVPYNALLIAREHMSVYAYMSIVETLFKLGIAFYILNTTNDRLVLYGILMFLSAFIVRSLYRVYCKRKFEESVYKFYYDKLYYRELLCFSAWSLFGNIASVARGQGSNILLNLFFGPVANAAYSLTQMVQGVVGSFVSNFQTALNPQITKNYAKGDVKSSINLMSISSKFSFFAMLIITAPFLFNVEYLMHLWLGEVPPYAIEFIKLALLYSLIETISNPLIIGAQATGKIKWYQIVIGSFIFLNLPMTWFVFKWLEDPIYVYWVLIANSFIALLFRIYFLRIMINLNIKDFFMKVIFRIVLVSALTFIVLSVLKIDKAINIAQLIFQLCVVSIITIGLIFFIGINKSERSFLLVSIKNKLKKRKV